MPAYELIIYFDVHNEHIIIHVLDEKDATVFENSSPLSTASFHPIARKNTHALFKAGRLCTVSFIA